MLDIATGREIKLTANDLSVADVFQNHYVIELAENSFGLIPIEEQPSSWAKAFIDTARQKNILPESFESRYTANCSRAEFCELAVKLYETSKGVISERKTFTDTTDVNVEKMAGLGVIKGMGDGIFAPDQNLTREQASAILSNLAKALGKELPAAEPAFADNGKISKWAKAFVGQVKAADIMNGVGGNQFAPQSPYTREQCVITMVKLADR